MAETKYMVNELDLLDGNHDTPEKTDSVPPIQLACEGLMTLVKNGHIPHEEALSQHRYMFPGDS